MKGFYSIILLAFLSSCAPFDGYKDNSHRWYHNSLNKTEKEKIYKSGEIVKSWNGTNSLGDYTRGNLIIKNGEKRNLFNFIETGKWEERHSGSLGKTIKSNIYDDYGNNLESKLYLLRGEKDQTKEILFEELKSSLSDSLRQEIINYHENGKVKSILYLTVVNYKEYKSDYLKEKYLTKIEVFDTNGNKLDPSHYENFSWFQPKVKMNKEKL